MLSITSSIKISIFYRTKYAIHSFLILKKNLFTKISKGFIYLLKYQKDYILMLNKMTSLETFSHAIM